MSKSSRTLGVNLVPLGTKAQYWNCNFEIRRPWSAKHPVFLDIIQVVRASMDDV